jgi:hypothetical protein
MVFLAYFNPCKCKLQQAVDNGVYVHRIFTVQGSGCTQTAQDNMIKTMTPLTNKKWENLSSINENKKIEDKQASFFIYRTQQQDSIRKLFLSACMLK